MERALAECGSDKVPGPDGINFSFIKVRWCFLKEFTNMLKEFHLRGRLNKVINEAFSTHFESAIPVQLGGYKPISLAGFVY